MFRIAAATLVAFTLVSASGGRQEPVDHDVNARIRQEAETNSQIMRTMHHLTDVHGPRLTGSPNFKNAAEWTINQMGEWGMANGRLEEWPFVNPDGSPRPGWLNERFSGHIVSPVKDSLVGEVLGWTPSTKGAVTAEAVAVAPPINVTKPELDQWVTETRSRIGGKIALVGRHNPIPVNFDTQALRRDDEAVRRQYDPDAPPGAGRGGRGGGRGGPATPPDPDRVPPAQITAAVNALMLDAGVLVRVNDGGRPHGQIRAFQNNTYDVTKAPPTVILRSEDYGRIWRMLLNGTPVTLEFDIVNRDYPEGSTQYNAIAEIPGTDKADEVIMLGGHLDSWHAATGATDNAIGCAVMMEAARIIQALGLKPRRTIRVALWGGEEQGLLGSQAYVREHFGTFEDPKQPAYDKFGGYFNVDSGTGRIRGASVFGPPEAATILRQILKPWEDYGVVGVIATSSRNRGGTDHTSFNEAGLPGIGLGQDPIEYQSHTWHTNLDTYERIVEEDVKRSAAAIASAVYHLAMRDELLPRFTKDAMPQPPGQGGGRGRGGQ
jgi:carboxypeptidase Q